MTPSLLAQIPAPEVLAAWLQAFAWLVGCVGGVLGCGVAIKSLRRAPAPVEVAQPLSIKAHTVFATQGDMDQVHGRIKRERLEIDKALQELRDADTRLQEKLETAIHDFNERIDHVPERVIKLLRETKGLL